MSLLLKREYDRALNMAKKASFHSPNWMMPTRTTTGAE